MLLKYFIAIFLSLSVLVNSTVFAADSYTVGASATVTIDEHSVCKKVSNTLGSGIMVPTKTANEWNTGGSSFLENLYTGVSASNCNTDLIPCGSFTELGDIIPAGFPAYVINDHAYAYAYHPPSGKAISVFASGTSPTKKIELMAITPPNGSTILQATLDTALVTVASGDLVFAANVKVINDYIFVTYRYSSAELPHQKMYSFDGTSFTLVNDFVGTTKQHIKQIYDYDGTYYIGVDSIISTATDTPNLASWQFTAGTMNQITVSPSVGFGVNGGNSFSGLIYDNGHIITGLEGYIRAYTYDGSTFTATNSAQLVSSRGGGEIKKYGDNYIFSSGFWAGKIRILGFDGTTFSFITPNISLGDTNGYFAEIGTVETDGTHIFFYNTNDGVDNAYTGIGAAFLNGTTQKLDIAEYVVKSPASLITVDIISTDPARITYGGKYYEYVAGTCGAGSSCTIPAISGGGTIPDGKSVHMTALEGVTNNCLPELRACTNGTLSGTNQYLGCFESIKVICTHYHSKGMLSDYLYEGETIYAELIDPRIMTGYHYWAIPTVKWLKNNTWVDPIIAPLVRGWATEVNYRLDRLEKGSVVGKVLLGIAEPVSVWIADYVVPKENNEEIEDKTITHYFKNTEKNI